MRPFYRASRYGMKNSVGYMVRRLSNLLLPQMEALFAGDDLTFSQWTVLMFLREYPASTAADLARDICHDAGSLTRIIDELEARGLVSRQRGEADRRVVALSLTPPGAALLESLIPRVTDFWNGLLADFSHLEAKLLIKLLSRLVVAVGGKRGPRPHRLHARPHHARGERHHHRHRRRKEEA